MNLRQAAEYCGVSISAVYRWLRKGLLRAERLGCHWSIDEYDLRPFTAVPADATLQMIDIARSTGFSLHTVWNWVRRDETLKSYCRGSRWYVKPKDLADFLCKHGVT